MLHSVTAMAEKNKQINSYIDTCRQDLDFFRESVKNNSAPFANEVDKKFHDWYEKGYKHALQLIDGIGDADDCYYVMKYYVNGFNLSHISLRGYVPLPPEQYPGILSAKKGDGHYIIYRHPALQYLGKAQVGDKLTHINGQKIEDYYQDYLLPFYANDRSKLTLESASIYALIVDGNRYKPVAKTITILHDDEEIKLDLKYTELDAGGLEAAREIKQPDISDSFKIEMVSNGVWIKIPSFFPSRSEIIYYVGMLSRLKNDLAQEDYILFDMRGNRGGASRWARPIIRNLWGDDFIKSLGTKHEYNQKWIKKLKVSRHNFLDFVKTQAKATVKKYKSQLKKKEDFFLKKWSIYDDTENLYTNTDSKKFNAKIYVLTDNFCRSTCWTFVKELKQLPNVIHIGEQTTVQSIYSYAKKERSPSENFDFFYPVQIRVEPNHKLGEALQPSEIYDGDFRDEAKLMDWVLSITEGQKN